MFRKLMIPLALGAMLAVAGCSSQSATPAASPSVMAAAPSPDASASPQRGAGFTKMLAQLGLTPDQKAKIDKIQQDHANDPDRKAMYKEIMAVLTPEQQDKMKQLRAQNHHHHAHGSDTPSASPSSSETP